MALTVRQVQTAKPGFHGDGDGLYLSVAAGGSRSWIFRFQLRGRRRELGLGGFPRVTLAEARDRAVDTRRLLAAGIDPIEARRGERAKAAVATVTFRDAAVRYISAHQASWRSPKHRQQWTSTLTTYVLPIFGSLPVEAVDTGLVMQALEPIWLATPATASRVRGRIEVILDAAKARGWRTGENPARWKGHLANLLPGASKVRATAHHPALAYAAISGFMAELRRQQGVGSRALEFAILTAARTGEVLGAKWDELNLGERLWVVPAERMKAGKEHRVPLSDAALAIVEQMSELRTSVFVFPGVRTGRPLGAMALLQALHGMGRNDLTAHGFRSTFSDWCAEQTDFSSEVREMALAHAVGDKVEAAYRRGDLFDKRRQLAEAWARFCGQGATEIFPLPRQLAG